MIGKQLTDLLLLADDSQTLPFVQVHPKMSQSTSAMQSEENQLNPQEHARCDSGQLEEI